MTSKHDQTNHHQKEEAPPQVLKIRELFACGKLVHPYLPAQHFASILQQQDQPPPNENHVEYQQQHSSSSSPVICNFTDLATALSQCCGVPPPPSKTNDNTHQESSGLIPPPAPPPTTSGTAAEHLATVIGGQKRKHIIFVLCDGLGSSILDFHLSSHNDGTNDGSSNHDTTITSSSDDNTSQKETYFLPKHQNPSISLRAVFPSTTPAALTTLATATWPGRHGIPGWDLRDQKYCDFPGEPSPGPVQLRILAERVMDVRGGGLAKDVGFGDDDDEWKDDVFIEEPWARRLLNDDNDDEEEGYSKSVKRDNASDCSPPSNERHDHRRKMLYVNAYNGDDFPTWYQGGTGEADNTTQSSSIPDNRQPDHKQNVAAASSGGTDFSSWQMGASSSQHNNTPPSTSCNCKKNQTPPGGFLFDTSTIGETCFETLGTPNGSEDAIHYFRNGINAVIRHIANAEQQNNNTYTYLYTSHPDKHMHALGVEHEEVNRVVRGIDKEMERLWDVLGDRERLISYLTDEGVRCHETDKKKSDSSKDRVDAAIIMTADHGHVTVEPEDMIQLPADVLACLEYANIGVHGKGRHAYLHCRSGHHQTLTKRWHNHKILSTSFLLLTIDEAITEGLFGPKPPRLQVRPRLGDYVAISTCRFTLVTPKESAKFANQKGGDEGGGGGCCQGAHGSLLKEEMEIPFVLCTP